MKRILFSIIALNLFMSTAHSAQYKLDEAHTVLGFKIRHLGFSWVRGKFNKSTGYADFNESTGKISNFLVTIDPASIDTNEKDRDEHLRKPDFFDVKKFKTLKFTVDKVDYKGKIPVRFNGKLLMHGKTLPVNFDISDWGQATDPWGNERIAFEAKAKIDRRKFGLTWNKGLKKVGGLTIGNEVHLNLNVEAIKQKPKSK